MKKPPDPTPIDAKTGNKYSHTCLRCGRSWESSIEVPNACRHCNTKYWNKERVRGQAKNAATDPPPPPQEPDDPSTTLDSDEAVKLNARERSRLVHLEKLLEVPDISIPEGVTRATPKSLASGSYLRKILAYCAPVIIPEFINAVRRNVRIGDNQAQKLTAEMYGVVQKSSGVSVFMSQNNANVSAASQGEPKAVRGMSTPDEMYRMLAEERHQRRITGRVVDLVATPIGEYDTEKPVQE